MVQSIAVFANFNVNVLVANAVRLPHTSTSSGATPAPHHAIGLEADRQPFVQPWDCAVIGLFLVGRHVGAYYLQTVT